MPGGDVYVPHFEPYLSIIVPAFRPTSLPKVSDNAIDWERYIDNRKSSVRSKVEHAFHIIKNRFGFTKVRYRGIAKNYHKLNVLFASTNLLMYAEAKKRSVKAVG